ncbi:GntR family transcriptional regulator [Wansuia hejianensis]|uniref:GntR family transcriptional regulator n=1 Tax=Wansuia hejianensis TaxID=2763667 RepID=A0A926F0T0_9FIRM|nr:GntR family transcriptional regulator [Wansuia hejianensis]MBC8589780.1 GntR family transcriptional regulator [Wansuia hejianensis]
MIFKDNLPIYIQIMNIIKKRIVSGNLKEGEKLPSVRELSTELKVNPNTIQRSYQELERENLVFTQRGMGTFITEDKEIIKELKRDMASSIINNFIENMKSLGFTSQDIIELVNNEVKEVK